MNRLSGIIREVSPCKDCTEKAYPYCYGDCPKDKRGEYGYGSWQADIQKVKENKKSYINMNRRKSWGKADI